MTEKTIRLYNGGKRHIQYGHDKESSFKPGTAVDFPIELGKRLQRLFAGEIRTPEDHLTAYVGDTFGSKEISKEAVDEAVDAAKIAADKKQLEAEIAAFEAEKAAWQAKKNADHESERKRAQERKEAVIEGAKEGRKESSSSKTKAKKAMEMAGSDENEAPLITFPKNDEII